MTQHTTTALLPHPSSPPPQQDAPEPGSILIGDAATKLVSVADASIDMTLTSPPYFRLRDYESEGQLGLESHVDDWVRALLPAMRQIARVLVPTGTLWLNLGDTYSTNPTHGAPTKSLVLAPERLALTLIKEGWILRNKIVWAKRNPMPTSVRDRLACTYEVVYVFARHPRYYFDLDSIREPHLSHPPKSSGPSAGRPPGHRESWRGSNSGSVSGLHAVKRDGRVGHPLGKNPGDVWPIATSRGHGAHHAAYPLELARRAIKAGCPEKRCSGCQLPWTRPVIRALGHKAVRQSLQPTCDCQLPGEPGIVLDPFLGSGTTAVAAESLGRRWMGCELNPIFAADARSRITKARQSDSAA